MGRNTHRQARPHIAPADGYIRVLAILLALFTGGLFILAMGYNPFAVYGTMISGSLGSQMVIRETVKQAVPLLISALA